MRTRSLRLLSPSMRWRRPEPPPPAHSSSGNLCGRSSDGVAQAGEVEIVRLDGRHDDRESRAAILARAHAYRLTHGVQIVQHEDGRFVEAQILDGLGDLTVFDEEGAITREPCEENGTRIDRPDVPESGDEYPALRGCDQVLDALRAARHA